MQRLALVLACVLTACGSPGKSGGNVSTDAQAGGGPGAGTGGGGGGGASPDASVATGGSPVHDAGNDVAWPPIPFDSGTVLTLDFEIDRSALPPLYFKDVTLLVDALGATNAQVVADGAEIPSVPHGTDVMFTTSGNAVQVRLLEPTRTADAGKFKAALLRDDKKWAFSVGFDDNNYYKNMADGIEALGWRGTMFLIGANISPDTLDESWTEGDTSLIARVNSGWSLGNHTWGHDAVNGDPAAAKISARKCSERLEGIIAKSKRPDYIVTAFAAPVFDPTWLPVILEMRDAQDTHLLFDESGRCCPGQAPMVIKGEAKLWEEIMFGFDLEVARNTHIESDATQMISEIDAAAAKVTPDHALWINTLSHGGGEKTVLPTMQHLHDTYGPGSTAEVWVAPSDEIYAYLLVSQKAKLRYTGSH